VFRPNEAQLGESTPLVDDHPAPARPGRDCRPPPAKRSAFVMAGCSEEASRIRGAGGTTRGISACRGDPTGLSASRQKPLCPSTKALRRWWGAGFGTRGPSGAPARRCEFVAGDEPGVQPARLQAPDGKSSARFADESLPGVKPDCRGDWRSSRRREPCTRGQVAWFHFVVSRWCFLWGRLVTLVARVVVPVRARGTPREVSRESRVPRVPHGVPPGHRGLGTDRTLRARPGGGTNLGFPFLVALPLWDRLG